MKRIFNKINKESESKFDAPIKPNSLSNEGGKNIHSKVAYQYPKGKFRFPVIPDNTNNKPKRGRSQSKPERVVEQGAPPNKGNREDRNRTSSRQTKGHTESSTSKQAFRPTEIPSPIHAFRKPEEKQLVEYELTGFNHEQVHNYTVSQVFDFQKENDLSDSEVRDYPEHDEQYIPVKSNIAYSEGEDMSLYMDETNNCLSMKDCEGIDEGELASSNDQANNIYVNDNIYANETETHVADKPQHSQVNRQVPFNVVMLKQDKERFEDRKRTSRLTRDKDLEPLIETKAVGFQKRPIDTDVLTEDYEFPALNLLTPPVTQTLNTEWLTIQQDRLNQTLINFNVGAKVVNVTQGPSVTRFEVQPEPGVKVNKITNLSDDIKLSLAAKDIRIEAPIPGKHTIGIEVPNQQSRPVLLSEIIKSNSFQSDPSPLSVALGLDISGQPVVTDLKKMPHGLIAGATGSGKSVCINSILVSILFKAHPNDVKLLLIDPKMVELAPYNHIPHLVSPVITDVKAATAALKWSVDEMERRYELFAHSGVRDINRFNELALEHKRYEEKLPYIVIVIDELADLMMMSPADVEEAICRIAQKARACGIHLIVATQRPSVDVITGLIKANIPTRVAFSVSSQVDSRTIIDISGAEKLLGKGDMLFLGNGTSKPVRLQGTFVSDFEIDQIVSHVRFQREPDYLFEQEELLKKTQVNEDEDDLFYEACEFIIEQGGASTSSLQRRFKIGYNRAARLIDMMEHHGFISEGRGSKPRDVLISATDLESFQD